MFRASNFDKLLDKATSNLRLDPDWPTILQICDQIRQNDCTPKYAVAAVKKKLYSQNPHQAMFALLTLESIVKNCGSGIHDEVTSKAFCETLCDLVKTTQHENLRSKILELIQAWAYAFRNNSKYRSVQDTVNILKAEGCKFPALKESDAMFSADTAPEWADGEVCHRCRVAFSLMVRRHHCRACGQVFCQQCSSKTSTLPKFGIEKEVRVCDACYDKVSRPPSSSAKLEIVDTSNDYGPTQPQKKQGKSAEELQEEEELQLALALSQSEAEHKEKERTKSRSHIAPEPTSLHPTSLHPTVSPSPSSISASPEHNNQTNSELSRYLDRNYWEQRLSREASAAPTAPASQPTHDAAEDTYAKPVTSKSHEDDAEDKEIDEFVETLKSQVEIFVNRMKSNSSRGRSIANDTSVQTLFMNITAMHSRLLRYIQLQDDKRVYLESLQDKVSQVRDSRAALDTLRAEHAARMAAAAEAQERQRQMQMAAKLQAMRKKKHEYLQYQRQLALQRVQEQEREMQMRQEQQKHQYMMATSSGFYMPGVSMHQFQPGFPNQSMYANNQFHPQMMPQPTAENSTNLPGQPQISQANLAPPSGTLAQSVPQFSNAYALSSSGMTLSQAPVSTQAAMIPQNNMRPVMSQLPMQQQLLMQQMHQMRMPVQAGIHQMLPQNMINGPGQSIPQQASQSVQQLPKQNLPNQTQHQPNVMMPPASIGQQNLGQPQLNTSNAVLGLQMQNMRMPIMQGQPNVSQSLPGYPINLQNQPNNQQQGPQMPNLQAPSQMTIQGQPMSMPNQQILQGQPLQGQTQGMTMTNNNMPNANPGVQQQPQNQHAQQNQHPQTLNQAVPAQAQQNMQLPGQQMNIQAQVPGHGPQNASQQLLMNQNQHMQGQMPHQMQGTIQHIAQIPQMQGQIPQNQPMPQNHVPQQMQQAQPQQGQPISLGQQMPPGQVMQTGQPMAPGQPMTQVQQITPGQQIPLGQQMPPGQQVPPGQQMPTGQQMPPGQQMSQPNMQPPNLKIQQQNMINSQGSQMGHNPPSQAPQTQPPAKSENNNNSSELISFD